MKTFTIDAENNITVFASKKEAAASTTHCDAFANQIEFAELTTDWPMQRLVEVWTAIPGVTPVSKFTSRKIAAERIWKAIQGLGESPKKQAPEASAPVSGLGPELTPGQESANAVELQQPEEAPAIGKEQQKQPEAPAQSETEPWPTEEVPVGEPSEEVATPGVPTQPKTRTTRAKKAPKASQNTEAAKSDAPREGSKTAQVVEMLRRQDGATITEIMSTMGWQKHTVRGFMAGAMKKAGFQVESFKPEGGERSYRINK